MMSRNCSNFLSSLQLIHSKIHIRFFFFPSIFKNDITQFQHVLILQLTLHEARLRHTTTALGLEPGRTRIIMFGGCPKWEWGTPDPDQKKLAKTTVLEFGEQICTWLSFFSSE